MNKAIFDTDNFSEVLKAKNSVVAATAARYSQEWTRLTISVITIMEIVKVGKSDNRPAESRRF